MASPRRKLLPAVPSQCPEPGGLGTTASILRQADAYVTGNRGKPGTSPNSSSAGVAGEDHRAPARSLQVPPQAGARTPPHGLVTLLSHPEDPRAWEQSNDLRASQYRPSNAECPTGYIDRPKRPQPSLPSWPRVWCASADATLAKYAGRDAVAKFHASAKKRGRA